MELISLWTSKCDVLLPTLTEFTRIFIALQVFSSNLKLQRTWLKYQCLSCVYFILPNIQWLREVISPIHLSKYCGNLQADDNSKDVHVTSQPILKFYKMNIPHKDCQM
jgi:hypothetical protein